MLDGSCFESRDPFECPDKWALFEQISALLRPGRATQTHRDTIEIAEAGGEVWPPDNPWGATLTVMQQYWAAFAEVLEYLHQRACAVVDEMFCSSVDETLAEWGVEYGFPDPCEHYADLCAKANAIGGTRCDYFVTLAALRGWSVSCLDCEDTAPASMRLGCGGWRLGDGHHIGCTCDGEAIFIVIDTAASPAYVAAEPPLLGCGWRLGDGHTLSCGPDLGSLQCLIDRVRPAHVPVHYVIA